VVVRRFAFFSLAGTALLGTAQVWAATVVVVRPVNASQAMAETVVRIRGELVSAGFQVEIAEGVDLEGTNDLRSRDSLEKLAEQRRADAAVAIIGDVAPNSVEAWVVDRVTGKSVMRRLSFEPQSNRAPQTLAIRAIELLRSSFLEIHLAPAEESGEARAEIPRAVERLVAFEPSSRLPERFGIEVGAGGVMAGGGVGPALLPVLLFDWALGRRLLLQATMAAWGTRPRVENRVGSAQVAQEFVLLGLLYRLGPGARVQPFVGVSAGALHTSVEGRASYPNQGLSAGRWSLLVDAGLGVRLRLHDRFYLATAAHLQLAEPYPSIVFLDENVATSGRPNVFLTLTMGTWL